MRKLYVLLSVLFLVSCSENKIQQPVGDGFEVLNINRVKTDIIVSYSIDILYKGKLNSKSIIEKVREIHQQYSELNMTVWTSKESYNNKRKGIYDSSIDENYIVKSQSSWSKKIDYLEWVQIFGQFEELYRKRVKLVSYKKPSTKNTKSKPKLDVLAKDEEYGIKDIREVTVTTDYDCRLLPDPDSNNALIRIPKNTRLVVIDSKDVQQGRMLNKWYKVEYGGYTGWTSGWNMKEEPKLRVLSYEESLKNYEKKIGKKPIHDALTGKLTSVDNWLKKNKNNYNTINYRRWYEPYVINNNWICRVQYDEKIGGITITSDMLFTISGGQIVDVSEK